MLRTIVLLVLASAPASAQTQQTVFEFGPCHLPPDPVLIGGLEALQAGIAYPEVERAQRVEGQVIVQFTVDSEGVPHDVVAVRRVSPGLDSAAVAAVRASRFAPLASDGWIEPTRMTLPVTFRLGPPERRAPR